MLDMLKRHEIQVLRKAGLEQEKVATIAGVSGRSVRHVEAEATVTVVDTAGGRYCQQNTEALDNMPAAPRHRSPSSRRS